MFTNYNRQALATTLWCYSMCGAVHWDTASPDKGQWEEPLPQSAAAAWRRRFISH